MHMQLSQRNYFRTLAGAALLGIALMVFGGRAYAQGQIPKLTFVTDGLSNFNGDAASSSGALQGNVRFTFRGSVDGERLKISGYVSRPEPPGGATPRFWRLRVPGNSTLINQQGKPQVEFRTNDPTYSGFQMRATNKRRGRPVCLPRCRGRTAGAGADTQVCPYVASQFVVNGTHPIENRCMTS